MKHHNVENKYPNNEVGKKQYDAALDGSGNSGKGVHMYESPYLWKENNIAIERDNPTENFVPTPTIHTGEELSPGKKALKIGLLVAFIAFMIYAFVAILLENPAVFGWNEISINKFF